MPLLIEPARAKVNLSLEVLGRRPDGYHEIASLVAFAACGDTVTLDDRAAAGFRVSGPFAGEIGDPNLAEAAIRAARDAGPALEVRSITLEKNLPVAAGLGGGSADAAAVLRIIARANPGRAGNIDWMRIAARLGADVPVCLADRPSWMLGLGERLTPVHLPPGLAIVLVNPGVPVSTAAVFRALEAPAFSGADAPGPGTYPASFASHAELLRELAGRGNDLAAPARRLAPVIADVEAELTSARGCRLARLSGSGATCFALFTDAACADEAARLISRRHPAWWVRRSELIAADETSPPHST